MRASDLRSNDEGAALILAIIFVGVIGLLVTVLANLAATNLMATSALRGARAIEYTADAATDAAIQNVRYKASEYPAVGLCTPGRPTATAVAANSTSVEVYCTGNLSPASAATRVVMFRACPANEGAGPCTTSPILEAKVTFDDYALTGLHLCTTVAPTTTATCGTGMTVNSWTVYSSNNTIVVNAAPSVATNSLPGATQGRPYAQTLTSSGGASPIMWSWTGGSLPAGLSLTPSGVISGTVATTASTSVFTVAATGSNGAAATASLTIVVNASPTVFSTTLAGATQGQRYSQILTSNGGTSPLTWGITAGSLPAGLNLGTSTGIISGTTALPATSQTFSVAVTDLNGASAGAALTITVASAPSITTVSMPGATQGGGYGATLTVNGGTSPLTWAITAGSLPAGLNLTAGTGVVSGTVGATATTASVTVSVTDANGVADSKALSIPVNAAPSVSTVTLTAATQGQSYSQTLTAFGGTSPMSWSITTGSLPAGLSLTAGTGVISGTTAVTATTQNFTVAVTDANQVIASKPLTINVVVPLFVTTTSLTTATQGQVGYSQTLVSSGGLNPITWSVSAGLLPTGLNLAATTGIISGTLSATATTKTFTVTVTDANGVTASKSLSITVNLSPSITTASLPAVTQGQSYSQTLASSGGTNPITWSVQTGSLPAGLSLAPLTGVISGTVSGTATSQTFTVAATDVNVVAATRPFTITVNGPPTVVTNSLPAATQGQVGYSQALVSSGGTNPISWSITTGSLPSGLTLAAGTGVVSGNVGATAVGTTFTVVATDANLIAAAKAVTIAVNVAPAVSTSSLLTATQGQVAYSQTLTSTGGTAPIAWSITGSLPAGLTVAPGTGVISGTVGAAATSQTFTVVATDANLIAGTRSLTITVNVPPTVTTVSLLTATQSQAGYSQTLASTGGSAPITWSITSGSLPNGLTLVPGTGVISGTVGAAATSQTFTVSATDANALAGTRSLTLTVNPAPSVSTVLLAAATQNQVGYSQTLASTGGTAPITWSITTGSLPTGLSLTTSTGVISGTIGVTATSQTFTVRVTDVNAAVATKSLTLTVNAAPSVSTSSLATATQGQVGYSQVLASSGGTNPVTWTVTIGTLPTGLTLASGTGVISGTIGGTATSQTFTVRVTDANLVAATRSLTIGVNVPPTVSTSSFAAATRGQIGYSQTLASTGGTAPITWSISTGSLPTGLTLAPTTGLISGTIGVTATSQTFTLVAADVNVVGATRSLTISVNAAPTVGTTSLAAATKGQVAYSQTVTSTGGTTPIAWTVSVGSLPTGLTLAPGTGVISGTVSVTATSQTFTVAAADANGVAGTKSLTITVNAAPTVGTTLLAAATKGQVAYNQTVTSTGGTTPIAWSITSGSLPAGLTLAPSTGIISGTVSVTATSQTFTLAATDANGVAGSTSFTITVNAAPSVTTVSVTGTAQGYVGYSQTLASSGGTTPITWSISTGSLPSGLTLAPSTGIISGTVGAAATSQTFTVVATDANGVAAIKSLTIAVAFSTPPTIVVPAAVTVGASTTITGSGFATNSTLTISFTDKDGQTLTAASVPATSDASGNLNGGLGIVVTVPAGLVHGTGNSEPGSVRVTDGSGNTAITLAVRFN